MTKLIAPNGCLFCELPKPVHWSRLDGLHPPGVWTWVEPSDRVRLQRMKRNRAIRKASTMFVTPGTPLSDVMPDYWVGLYVTYHGRNRQDRLGNGRVFTIAEQRDDDGAVGLYIDGVGNLEWVAPTALRVFSSGPEDVNPQPMTVEQAEEILNPHSNTLDSLDAEIKRLEEKIKDLRHARQVIAGL